jgi:valyl-tRNA synthetase
VLDTWFSSALWPFATLGWPEDTANLRAFYPTDVLSTARDILFLWVARMVMMGLRFPGDIPFTDVNVHSVIQGPDGRRMSKSLGTGVDPIDLIEGGPRPPAFPQGGDFPAYGADAVRFGLLAMSSTQDVRFSEEKVAQGAQLTNKLFNASRLVLTNLADGVEAAPRPSTVEDRWILSRLQRAKADVAERLGEFDFAKLALGLYDFVFAELCDWYLELVKPRLYDGDADAQATLLHVLRETLALAHPVIPFVTEEIWSLLPEEDSLLAGSRMPGVDDALVDAEAEAQVGRAIEAIRALRGWRESVDVRPGVEVSAVLQADGYEATADLIGRMARFAWASNGSAGEPAATVPVPGGAVGILPAEGVDLGAAERKRDAERTRLQAEVRRAEGKLANEGFTAKAPQQVVDAERQKLERLRAELGAL